MLSGSSISIIFILAEVSFVLAVVIYFVRKKLTAARRQADLLGHALEEERSAKTFRGKLKDFFEQEIKRTSARYDELMGNGEQNSEKGNLLLTRKNALNIERKASQKNPLDSDYWENLQRAYSRFVPEQAQEESPPREQDANEETPSEKTAKADGIAEIALNKAASEELSRLHNVINNQYDSIDALKSQLLAIKDDEALAEHPIISEFNEQISRLLADQDQMAMCLKVLEGENERLSKRLVELEEQGGAEDLEQAENLIRDLLRTNKEQLQCIATLESELEMKHEIELGADQADLLVMLQKTKQEVKQLNQEKLENLASLDQLQREVESLRENVSSSTASGTDDEKKSLEKQLHAKTAELELLREEYQSMHDKYIKLYQDKAS